MPRMVRHDLNGPIKIERPGLEKPIWVCGCGLSANFPICDGTHKTACPAEPPGVLCIYAPDRRTITETRPDPGAPTPPSPTP